MIATVISAFNSLTLSPALAALLIKPGHAKKDLLSRFIDAALGWFFRLFNRAFNLGIARYGAVVRRLLRVSGLVLVVYVGLLALTGLMFEKVPAGFIPTMDQGYLVVFAQLPDGASLQRDDDVRRQIAEIAKKTPGVERTFAIEGLSILDSTTKPNALTAFFILKPFSERIGHREQSATAIAAKRQEMLSGKGRVEAAPEAARLRLRPTLMTSFAFILGVLPLAIAKGPGAEMNQALGTAVFAGMIGVTFFGIFFTPVFFSVIMKIFTRPPKKKRPGSIERGGQIPRGRI